jgi:chromosome segregation ATPase
VGLVERDITPQVRTEVARTLEAAMADPSSAQAVQSGQLVRALSYAGLGGVDLEGAVADLPKPRPAVRKDASKKLQKLESAALDAQGALDDAVRLAERTSQAFEVADAEAQSSARDVARDEARAEALRQQLKEAEQELQTSRSRHSKAAKDLEELQRKAERATKAVAEAQDAADAARKALDLARRS